MKKIGIEINGVLRDTIGKFTQVYEKHMIDEMGEDSKTFNIDMSGNTELNTKEDIFEYKIISEVTSLDLLNHFSFKNQEELYSFMYEDFVMQIFGHAGSSETFSFNDLNDFYLEFRDKYEIIILSDEIGRSKPSSLFFLSKFGCLIETIKFYSNTTKKTILDNIDIIVTANPDIISELSKEKKIIKYVTNYNQKNKSEYEISSLKELNKCLQKLSIC
jgi:hypothetical protein